MPSEPSNEFGPLYLRHMQCLRRKQKSMSNKTAKQIIARQNNQFRQLVSNLVESSPGKIVKVESALEIVCKKEHHRPTQLPAYCFCWVCAAKCSRKRGLYSIIHAIPVENYRCAFRNALLQLKYSLNSVYFSLLFLKIALFW